MCETPKRSILHDKIRLLTIPPSPFLQKLGYGTSITVYKLNRSPSRSPWALKKISRQSKSSNNEMNARLNFEASILKTLSHPNIVGFRALLTETDGRSCLAMEDCCISLGDLIEKRVEDGILQPFNAKQIRKVAVDIAAALQYLHHTALILHCDIKSYNILIKDEFQVCKVCDFGVSMPLTLEGAIDYEKVGHEVEYAGTTCWWPPEVFLDPQIITSKADIYSYGLTLWEMMSLEPPFTQNLEDTADSVYLIEDNESDESDIHSKNEETHERRPEIPCESLDDSYISILQIYHLTTETNHTKRPNAKDLCLIIEDLHQDDK